MMQVGNSRLQAGSGSILVVEDDESVRNITRTMLERVGFRVLAAAGGREALDLFGKHSGEVALALVDLGLPDIDGVETIRRMRVLRPDLKAVLTSGYTEDEATVKFAEKGLEGFLQKPYGLAELVGMVRKVLEAGYD